MSIIKKLLLLALSTCLLAILIGCASRAPLPSTLNILPPSPDVPNKLSAFSGMWKEQSFDIILVVEKIDSQKAEVILSYGMVPGYDPSYAYHTATVLSEDSIEIIEPNGDKIIFKMDEELNNLSGEVIIKKTGGKYKLFMSRKNTK